MLGELDFGVTMQLNIIYLGVAVGLNELNFIISVISQIYFYLCQSAKVIIR